jgi:hypothetical protein
MMVTSITMNQIRIGATLAVLALIGACTRSEPPLAPPPPSLTSPVSFDGTYRGSIRVTSAGISGGQTNWCDTPSAISLSLQNSTFNYVLLHPNVPKDSNYSLSPTFAVAVGPDGSFNATSQNGEAQMVGQITGSQLSGQINGTACNYAFTADKS